MSIFTLNVANVLSALDGGSVLSILNSTTFPQYQIRTASGAIALPISGVKEITAGRSASITRAPVEEGKYQSINKVRDPGRIRVDILLAGLTAFSGDIPNLFDLTLTSQSDSLAIIKSMIETASTYDIDTPKETYESYDLVSCDHTVSRSTGPTLLTVHLEFQEVMQQANVVMSSVQSTNSLTSNSTTASTSGVSSTVQQASATTTALDDLKSSWSKLKSATSTLTTTVSDAVTTTLTSATSTVSKTAEELASSAVDKSAGIITSINSAIT